MTESRLRNQITQGSDRGYGPAEVNESALHVPVRTGPGGRPIHPTGCSFPTERTPFSSPFFHPRSRGLLFEFEQGQRQLNLDGVLENFRIKLKEFLDLAEPINQGIPVDVEPLGGFSQVQVLGEITTDRL